VQVGPELTEIGNKLSREAFLESIMYPSAGNSHSYETYTVELKDGNVLSGLLVSQTDDELQIKNNEGVVRRFGRKEIDRVAQQPVSLMPADLHQNLTEQDLVDLVEYLLTLRKGQDPVSGIP
jgi:putative heme-binding domain-containing protein